MPDRLLLALLVSLIAAGIGWAAPPRIVAIALPGTASPLDDPRLARLGAIGLISPPPPEAPAAPGAIEDYLPRAQRGELILALFGRRAPGALPETVMISPALPPGALLTSPATRTRGLIAARDLTPQGRPVRALASADAIGETRALAQRIAIVEETKLALLAFYGALAGGAVLLGCLALRQPGFARLARSGLVLAASGASALLLTTPLLAFANEHAPMRASLAFLAVSALLALLCQRLTRSLTLLTGILLIDTLTGGRLVAFSPLSGYYQAGIRYYGIGNEYMGLWIGASLMGLPRRLLGMGGLLITLLLGLPSLGADAGGTMASTVAFGTACFPQRWGRGRLPLACGLALVAAALLALLDRLQPDAAQSHIGQAAARGPAVWGQIIARKLAMNARLSTMPATLLALVGLVPVWWALTRGPLRDRLHATLAAFPDTAARLPAALAGALAALLLNDSGIVAALLLLAPVTTTVIERALCATSPSIMEPDGSA